MNRVLKKILLYLTGTFSSKALNLLIVPMYVIYVTPEELGSFDFQQNLMNLFMPIIVLAIWESLLAFGLKNNYNKERVISTTLFFSVFMVIVFIAISFIYLLFASKSIPFNTYYLVMISLSPLVNVFTYLSRVMRKDKVFVRSGILSSFIRVGSLFLLFQTKLPPELVLILSYISQEFFVIFYIFFKLKVWKMIKIEKFDLSLLKKMLKFSLPLVMNLVSLWLLSGYSRIFININYGNKINGLYSFALQCVIVVSMIGQVINMATLEEVLMDKEEDFRVKYNKSLNVIIFVLLSLSILAVLSFSIIFQLFNLEQYAGSMQYIPIAMFNTVIVSIASNITNVFQKTNSTDIIFKTTIVSAFVNIIFVYLLNILFGLHGILIAQAISSAVLLYYRYKLSKKIITYSIVNYKNILLLLSYIVVSLNVMYINNFVLNIILLISCLVFILRKMLIKEKWSI